MGGVEGGIREDSPYPDYAVIKLANYVVILCTCLNLKPRNSVFNLNTNLIRIV